MGLPDKTCLTDKEMYDNIIVVLSAVCRNELTVYKQMNDDFLVNTLIIHFGGWQTAYFHGLKPLNSDVLAAHTIIFPITILLYALLLRAV